MKSKDPGKQVILVKYHRRKDGHNEDEQCGLFV